MTIRIFFIAIFFTFIFNSYGQNSDKISISFKGDTLKEVLLKLEKVTNKKFYFNEDWFDKNQIYTKNYMDADLSEILLDVLQKAGINYTILKDKVIITNKNILQKGLSKNYFNQKKDEKKNEIPIFLKEKIDKNNDVIVIGRLHAKSQKKYYQLKGKVTRVSNNQRLKNAKVYLKGENYSTRTDANGNFILNVPYGYHILTVSKGNFKTFSQKLIVFSDGTYNVKLFDVSEQLKAVVVTGKIHNNIKSVKLGVTKIKAVTAKVVPVVFGERDILKIATTLPGVKTAGEGTLGYNVRGGKVDQNLILLDNATIYNPSHFFGVFSAINPFSTASADIYKGSLPVEYGGRLSSIIDIKTKTVSKNKFKGEGNLGLVTSNLMVEVPIKKDKTAVLAGFRTTYSNIVLKQIKNDAIYKSEVSFLDGIVRFNSDINKNNTINSTLYYSKDKYSISSDTLNQYENKLFSLEWKHQFNKNNKMNLQFNNTIYDFNITNEGIYHNNYNIYFGIAENEFKLKLNKILGKKHTFTYGINSKLYRINPGEIKPLGTESTILARKIPNEKGLESGVFISDKYDVSKKLSIDLGFRYSFYMNLGEADVNIYPENVTHSEENIIDVKHYNNNQIVKSYGYPELRFSARYAFTPDLSIKTSISNSSQFIHLLSSNTTATPIDTWKLSGPYIKPQKSVLASFGVFKNLNDNMYEISLETYYKKMYDILEYKIGAELLLNENIENEILQAEGKSYGVEFLIKKNKGRFNGWLSYSYSRALVKVFASSFVDLVNNGDYFPANYDKPHDLSLIMNYKLTKRYSFSCNFVYQTGRPITYPIGRYDYSGAEHVLYSERNAFRIPDYYRLDLGVNIEGNHKIKKLAHSFWNISVYNVLGRHNPFSIFFVNEAGNIQAYQTSIFAVPIPSISYNFKF